MLIWDAKLQIFAVINNDFQKINSFRRKIGQDKEKVKERPHEKEHPFTSVSYK
jgi:hypothetical protein